MRSRRVFQAVDSHTEGMPTRVVTSGVGTIAGATMSERRAHFERELDWIRTSLMHEPRGHSAMSGAILQPSTSPDADWGVLFIEVSGCLAMCGHGTIGVATVLVETGMVEPTPPITRVRLDVPAGQVEAQVATSPDGRAESVSLRNVPAFLLDSDLRVEVPSLGEVTYDLAYGGNFYVIVDATSHGLDIRPAAAPSLIAAGLELMEAVAREGPPIHPVDQNIEGVKHVIFHGPGANGASARNAVAIHPGWVDRSPCGTGTSARMAQLHARGELGKGERFVNESILGSRFVGRILEETTVGDLPAIVPEISGRAWITGMGEYLIDPGDPFAEGFQLDAVERGFDRGTARSAVGKG